MNIKLLGVRGSLPSPMRNEEYSFKIRSILELAVEKNLHDKSEIKDFIQNLPYELRYVIGGDTTCAVVTEGNTTILLDAGTGIRHFGEKLLSGPCGKGEGELHFFITHTHWDHIQGLPFFKPLYIPGNKIHFYSPLPDLEERLQYQTDFRFFPMPFEQTGSTKFFHYMEISSPVELPGNIRVDSHTLKHPGGSTAYRFRQNGRTFIFATDAEFTGDDLLHGEGNQEFFDQADLLVLDAQYTLDESFAKFDWGHTSYTMAVNCGTRWNIKNLVLTHHEPAYPDAKIYINYLDSIQHRKELKQELPKIHLAREGLQFQVG